MTVSSSSIPVTVSSLRSNLYDIFTDQETDESGEVDVTLTRTPTDINHISIQSLTAGYLAFPSSLDGVTLTVVVRKMKYDKSDTDVGTPENLPTSVTVDTTEGGFALTSGAPSASSAGGNNSPSNIPALAHTHTTTVNKIHSHTHANSYTETDFPLATSQGSLNFMVIYE